MEVINMKNSSSRNMSTERMSREAQVIFEYLHSGLHCLRRTSENASFNNWKFASLSTPGNALSRSWIDAVKHVWFIKISAELQVWLVLFVEQISGLYLNSGGLEKGLQINPKSLNFNDDDTDFSSEIFTFTYKNSMVSDQID